ncbi:MAG: ATP-binding protein [Litorimonas sp.]
MATSPRKFRFFISVKAKLFGGFLAMTMLIAGLGGYALVSIDNAGNVVTDTFDRPLMAVNFARSASQTFSALEIETLRSSDPENPEVYFNWLAEEFTEDLKIARERSISPKADAFFEDVTRDFAEWKVRERTALGADERTTENDELSLQIEESLDIIVELQTNESFRNRESALATMARIRQFSFIAVAAAIMLTLGLTAWIAVTIIRPLKSAARAAAKISAGELNVKIPRGGQDETGQLLRTMQSMQSSIRTRMATEQDLRTLAQHRLADSLENSKDAVLLTDVDSQIIVANPGVVVLFPNLLDEMTETALIGLACETLFSADGVPLHLEQDGPQTGNEFRLPDGRWVRVNASATREGGRLFIWSDITESKTHAERLRIARDAAEAASRAKTLFLATMSHEMNTPLNAIIGLSDVLKMQHSASGGNSSHAEMAAMISQSGSNMAQIVKDVLEIASDDEAIIALAQLNAIDLADPIERAVLSFKSKVDRAKVRLIWSRPEMPNQIAADAADMEQLAVKLIDNAIKFNRPGGAVKVQLTPLSDHRVRLDIIDTGIGIAADDHDRILQPFVQLDTGYTRTVDGTGLGLCVADRIARRHGTQLQIHSTPGKGSVFSVLFRRKVAPTKRDTSNGSETSQRNTERHAA